MFRYKLAVILAGGKSTRMGSEKAFIYLNENFLIDHIIFLLFDIGFSKIILSGFNLGYFIIPDKFKNSGPLSGIYSLNVKKRFYTHFLILSIDMPFLNRALIFFLILNSNNKFSYNYMQHVFPFLLANKKCRYVLSNNQFLTKKKNNNLFYFFLTPHYSKTIIYIFIKKKIL